jgi:hypothetical protein
MMLRDSDDYDDNDDDDRDDDDNDDSDDDYDDNDDGHHHLYLPSSLIHRLPIPQLLSIVAQRILGYPLQLLDNNYQGNNNPNCHDTKQQQ